VEQGFTYAFDQYQINYELIWKSKKPNLVMVFKNIIESTTILSYTLKCHKLS